jgi:O-antigen ligase
MWYSGSMQTNTWLKNSVLALVFVVPFIPFLVFSNFFFPFITSKAFTFRIIVELAFLLWIILALRDTAYRPRLSWISKSFLIFIVVVGIANLFGVAPLKSFWSNFERMEGFISLIHFGFYFLVLSSVLKTEGIWKAFWNTTLSASLIMVFYCLFQLAGALEINQGGVRVDGTLGNATYLAVYMLLHIFIAAFLYAREKRGSAWRIFYPISIALNLLILYFTATRGAILGLIIGIVVSSLLMIFGARENMKVRKGAVIALAVLVVLSGLFIAIRNTSFVTGSPVLARFSTLSLSDFKKQGRYFIWPMAIDGIKERPILGWGQENFTQIFNEKYNPLMYTQEQWFDRTHDIVLDWGVAAGLIGVISYLSIFVVLLYYIWKRVASFSFLEKSILTGLLAAYFFQNIFVFDNLVSYILFLSLLAFIHMHSSREEGYKENRISMPLSTALSVVAVLAISFTLYYWNVRPIQANTLLIKALQSSQSKNVDEVKKTLGYFKSAVNKSSLGRGEAREQIVAISDRMLNSSMSEEDKNAYLEFAKAEIIAQTKEFPNDARYQLIAGSFFARSGSPDEALVFLNRAGELSPRKQSILIEKGAVYIRKRDFVAALAEFKKAYDLAPAYDEAKIIYLVGAIYAKDEVLIKKLISEIPSNAILNDNRVVSALADNGRLNDVLVILRERINTMPNVRDNYVALASVLLQAGQKNEAINVLTKLGEMVPEAKTDADEYIRRIKAGEL